MRKMLLVLFGICTCFQVSLAFPSEPPQPTPSDFRDLLQVLPLKEIAEIKQKHLKSDPNFEAAIIYLKSPDWTTTLAEVRATPEWAQYKNFVKEAGLDLDYIVTHLEHCVNSTDVTAFKTEGAKPSLKNFLNDVKMSYGMTILKNLNAYAEKNFNNPAHVKLRQKLSTPEAGELLQKALEQPALKKLLMKLKTLDVNTDYILQLIFAFNNWQRVPASSVSP